MSDGKRGWRPGRGGCGCVSGCGSFIFVFLLGGLLSLFGTVFGLGVSVGIPFTQSNITLAGAIGTKAKVVDGLPGYTQGRLAGNQNFINQSGTLTVGPAEGAGLLVIGAQPGAPTIDLYIVLR
jgi:hypothetical protein